MASEANVSQKKPTPMLRSLVSSLRYEHLTAGMAGGIASTLILHPLDLIKIRFAGEKSAAGPGGQHAN